MKPAKVRISRICERGYVVANDGGAIVTRDLHPTCSGYEDRAQGRRFKCQCRCHRKAKQP